MRYKGEHIEGRSIPFDNILINLDIEDGRIKLEPVSFAVGGGDIELHADLAPVSGRDVKANARIDLKHVSLDRLLAATHLVEGAGTLTGNAEIDSTGNSVATLLGHGNGGFAAGLSGGNLSALLVDIAGLEVGNALLSALGVPQRANLQCFAAEYTLKDGLMQTKELIVDTSEAQVRGTGDINLANETLDYKLVTKSKHFSVGTLSTPIDIGGTLKSPSIKPEIGPLALKGGAAVGLGVLFPPAAILPTIQFGTGENGACQAAEAPIGRWRLGGIGGEQADPRLGARAWGKAEVGGQAGWRARSSAISNAATWSEWAKIPRGKLVTMSCTGSRRTTMPSSPSSSTGWAVGRHPVARKACTRLV